MKPHHHAFALVVLLALLSLVAWLAYWHHEGAWRFGFTI
jgi:hypothetical protein